jgi:lysozyme
MPSVHARIERVRERYDSRVDRARERVRRQIKRWRRDESELVAAIRRGATGISKDGVEFIASWEGFVDHPYKPVSSEPYWTWGYGHYGPDVPAPGSGRTISRQAALVLLQKDCADAEAAVRRLVTVRLEQDEFDVLVSFTFNCGAGALESSDLLAAVNAGRKGDVPDELMRWVYDGNGNRLEGLVRRRSAEARKWRD